MAQHKVCVLSFGNTSLSTFLMTTAPQDYPLSTSSVTFSSDQMIHIVSVSIVNDAILENVENLSVVITGQNRVEGGQRAYIHIYDDDSETVTFTLEIRAICVCVSIYLSVCLSECLSICSHPCLSVLLFCLSI